MQISVCVFIVRREQVRHTEMNGVEMGREWEKWRTRWYFWVWAACDLAFSIRIKYIFWTTWNILAPCLELSLFIVCFVVVQYILAAVRSLIKPVANASACPCQYQILSAYTCVCCWFCKPYICCIVQMCWCFSTHTHTHFTALRMVSPFFPPSFCLSVFVIHFLRVWSFRFILSFACFCIPQLDKKQCELNLTVQFLWQISPFRMRWNVAYIIKMNGWLEGKEWIEVTVLLFVYFFQVHD